MTGQAECAAISTATENSALVCQTRENQERG